MIQILFLLAALTAAASEPARVHVHANKDGDGPFSVTVNVVDEIKGVEDTRPSTWGLTGSYASVIHFDDVPRGHRVRILRVYGDFTAVVRWPQTITAGTSCEIGWGLKTTAPDASADVSYPGYAVRPFGNTMFWIQDWLLPETPRSRAPFSEDVSAGGLLQPDDDLIAQAFVALNTTGSTIHMEPVVTIVYRLEKQ